MNGTSTRMPPARTRGERQGGYVSGANALKIGYADPPTAPVRRTGRGRPEAPSTGQRSAETPRRPAVVPLPIKLPRARFLVLIAAGLALGLGLEVGFWTLSVALAAVSIASLLPVTVAGFGTREATMLLFLGAAGIRWSQIIAFSLARFRVPGGGLPDNWDPSRTRVSIPRHRIRRRRRRVRRTAHGARIG